MIMMEGQKIDNGLEFTFCMFFTSTNLYFADVNGWEDEHVKLKFTLCKLVKISAAIITVASKQSSLDILTFKLKTFKVFGNFAGCTSGDNSGKVYI